MNEKQLRQRAKAAVAAGKYPSEYAYYRALVLLIGPESEPYYDWKFIASKLMLEMEPDPLPPVVRKWEKK